MSYESITEVKVTKENDGTVTTTGYFGASAGSFEVKFIGDGGNADKHVVTLSGGQFESMSGEPTTFTIYGAWEIREVADLLKFVTSEAVI